MTTGNLLGVGENNVGARFPFVDHVPLPGVGRNKSGRYGHCSGDNNGRVC